MSATRSLRVVLAEDSVLVREGIIGVLERFGHEVVAALHDTGELEATVLRHEPDVVVTDVRMPPTFTDEGLRAALVLRKRWPALPVLVLSQYVQQTYATELLEASDTGGVGYLLKDRIGRIEEFVGAVGEVSAGGTVVDPEVVRQLLGGQRGKRDGRNGSLTRLSPREHEVLELMAEGRSNTAIARRLVVTEAAVAKHINAILTKLDLPPDVDGHRRVMAVLAFLRG